jgi:anthranilate/para-aminobenzoate synthase component II
MAGRSILYLGDSEFSAGFCNKLEAYACCAELLKHSTLSMPDDQPETIDLIMLEPGPRSAETEKSLQSLISELGDHPVIAVTTRENEHRGIAALRAGA